MTTSTELDLGAIRTRRHDARKALGYMTLGWPEGSPTHSRVAASLDDIVALDDEIERLLARVAAGLALAEKWERSASAMDARVPGASVVAGTIRAQADQLRAALREDR